MVYKQCFSFENKNRQSNTFSTLTGDSLNNVQVTDAKPV